MVQTKKQLGRLRQHVHAEKKREITRYDQGSPGLQLAMHQGMKCRATRWLIIVLNQLGSFARDVAYC